ncbi:unnamed protein product [Sphagnum compactum]
MARGRLSAIFLQRARLRHFPSPWRATSALSKLGVVEYSCASEEGGALLMGQRERSYSSAAVSAAYAARNYANNIAEYNRALLEINNSRRSYLMRDVYEDMQIDGVQPMRDTFHTLITGCMKGDRLQDVMYFFDEMKTMGLVPDVVLYNCVITSCGRCNQIDRAFQVAEEMESYGIQPKHRTFLALLKSCGTAGRVDEAYGVVRRMAACGLTLNSSCYSALIMAYKNRKPVNEDTVHKIFELLEQSKGCEGGSAEGEARDDFEEELASLVTGGDLQPTRSYVNRRFTVYFAALRAFAELGNATAVKSVIEMLEQAGYQVDASSVTELVKCHIAQGDLENAVTVFDKFVESGKNPTLNLYITLIQGCLMKLNSFKLASAKRLLEQMDQRGYFLNTIIGSNLLTLASNEYGGDFSTANCIWDMMQKRNLRLSFRAVSAYYNGLQRHKVPEDDARLVAVREVVTKNQKRFNWTSGPQPGADQGAEHEGDIERGSRKLKEPF